MVGEQSMTPLLVACQNLALPSDELKPFWVPNSVYPDRGVVEIEELALLSGFARYVKADHVIETGSYSGSSAGIFDEVCDDVWSIDTGAYFHHGEFRAFYGEKAIAAGFHLSDPIRHRINFLYGIGHLKIPRIRKWCSGVILFYHDSDHSYENVIAELNAGRNIGARAVAVHDVVYDQACRAAWEDWVTANKPKASAISDTFWGLGMAIL
jgi:hypothetical protein